MTRARDVADTQSGTVALTSADGVGDNANALTVTNSEATSGRNFGMKVVGGTNASDHSFRADNSSGTPLFEVQGDGVINIANGVGTLFSNSGTFTIDANANLTFRGGVHTFDNADGSAEYMRIDSNGNLGINGNPISYANGQAALFIEDTTNPAIGISDTGQSKDYYIVANGSRLGIVYGDGSNSGSFSNSTEIASFNNNGKVGLGTDNPSANFVVSNGTEEHQVAFASGEVYLMARNQSAYITQEYIANQHVFTGYGDNSSNEAMRIDSSGNICVNDTTTRLPNGNTVNIAGDNSTHGLSVVRYNSSYGTYAINIGRSKNNTVGGNTALANDDVIGYVTWYANDGTDTNSIAAQIEARIDGTVAGNNVPGELVFRTSADGHGGGAGSEKMVITSGGIVRFAGASTLTEDNTASITNLGIGYFTRSSGSGVTHQLFYNGGANVGSINSSASSTTFNTSSDYRLKENVSYDWDATSRLKQLKPARFNFKIDKDTTVDGFLAHEVSSIVPEAITGEKDALEVWEDGEELPEGVSVGDNKLDADGNTVPEYQRIDQSKLVPLLVKTIQELEARIAKLEG